MTVKCSHLGHIKICSNDAGALRPTGQRAIACFECGRLFGWLDVNEHMTAFNPAPAAGITPISDHLATIDSARLHVMHRDLFSRMQQMVRYEDPLSTKRTNGPIKDAFQQVSRELEDRLHRSEQAVSHMPQSQVAGFHEDDVRLLWDHMQDIARGEAPTPRIHALSAMQLFEAAVAAMPSMEKRPDA